jgi:hypothetical protein
MIARTLLIAPAVALALATFTVPGVAGQRVVLPAAPPIPRPVVVQQTKQTVLILHRHPVVQPVFVRVPFFVPWIPLVFSAPAFAGFAQSRNTCAEQQPLTFGDLARGGPGPMFAPVTFGSQSGTTMSELPFPAAPSMSFQTANAFCSAPTLDLSTIDLNN